MSCSMTRRSDAGEARNCGPLVSSSQCLNTKCGQSKLFGTGPGRRPGWAGYGSRLFGQTQIWVYRFCRIFKRKYGHIHGIQKSLAIQMPKLRKRDIHNTFFEGVYTWRRRKRGVFGHTSVLCHTWGVAPPPPPPPPPPPRQ